jgi:site-specific DNA-methyltransferase (adenine-specific)
MSIEVNKIYCGDCLKVMETFPDNCIDLIICDLPYGITKCEWDIQIQLDRLWEQYNRIKKQNTAIILFSKPPFDKLLACSNINMFKYEWIWEKTNGVGYLNAKKMPLQCHENILVFYDKLPTYNPQITDNHKRKISKINQRINCKDGGIYNDHSNRKDYNSTKRYPRDVLVFKSDKQVCNIHPAQKPLKLIEYFIKTYSNEGDIVLDNCLGSGTTALASKRLNRSFVGIEIDPYYVEKANERVYGNQCI